MMSLKPTRRKFSQPNILLALDWFDERIYRGIVRYSKEAGWHLSPYLMSGRFIPYGWPADGAITCYGDTLGEFIDSLKMPKVDISFADMKEQVPRVQVSNEEIGQLAAKHFVKRGFKHFAYFNWPDVKVNTLRRDAYFKALDEMGMDAKQRYEINQPSGEIISDWFKHQAALISQLEKLPRPLAVFAGQDNLGSTMIETCVRHGIHVPEEVAVLGVDNIELLCEGMMVSLSSIDTRIEDLGYEAARRLDQLLKKEISKTAPPVVLSPKGVEARQSTDILAVDHPAVVHALKYMKDNFHRPITLEDVSVETGMSKRGLEKAFLKHLERTPAEALRRFRLDAAKLMLTDTNDKIDAIAYNCGYSNSSNLSFAFRKDTGMSPRTYRKKHSA